MPQWHECYLPRGKLLATVCGNLLSFLSVPRNDGTHVLVVTQHCRLGSVMNDVKYLNANKNLSFS